MLRELNIENVAVIEKSAVEFSEGLNVLTGETGAGKSILIDSINAILGNRTSREIVRSGADRSVIWASFSDVDTSVNDVLSEAGYEVDDTLLVYREITADGKSLCRVNNRPSTAAFVREVCSKLINIHGQHDNQDLLNPEKHLFIIDNFAGLCELRNEYTSLYLRLSELHSEMERLATDDNEKARRLDLLRYQTDEIEKAKLVAGEEEELNERRKLIRNSEKILEALSGAYSALSGDDDSLAALDGLFSASEQLNGVKEFSADVTATATKLEEAYYAAKDASQELRDYLDGFEFDSGALSETEERLDLIFRLKQKYGSSIDEILDFAQRASDELKSIERSDETLEGLKKEFSVLLGEAREKAEELSKRRKDSFPVFEGRIRDELEYLNMPGVTFSAVCEESQLTKTGKDKIEFYISTNPGEPPKQLAKIASGGELSRIMLSIKNAMADKDDIGTLIFDEIDTGVSGVSAQRIGQKLKQSAASRQTICVTHSAPIAAYADRHLYIEKNVRDGRTFTDIMPLDREGRRNELARMISGDNITETALQNAAEMLSLAGEAKS